MAGKTQAHSDTVLGLVTAGHAVGLFSTAPASDNAAGTELAGLGYARQAIAFGAITTDADGHTRKMSNSGVLTFGPAGEAWLQAVAFGLFEIASGALKYWDALPVPKTCASGDRLEFAIGAFVVSED
jgi:hypothetical protein